jgi:hypothetical protein
MTYRIVHVLTRICGSFIELVDETLGSEVHIEEAETMVKVALLCTNAKVLFLIYVFG